MTLLWLGCQRDNERNQGQCEKNVLGEDIKAECLKDLKGFPGLSCWSEQPAIWRIYINTRKFSPGFLNSHYNSKTIRLKTINLLFCSFFSQNITFPLTPRGFMVATHIEPWVFLHSSVSKESACNAGDPGSIPVLGRSPGERSGTHSSILAWKIPWTEEPGGLQSMGSHRVGHDWVHTHPHTHTHTPTYRKQLKLVINDPIQFTKQILGRHFLLQSIYCAR